MLLLELRYRPPSGYFALIPIVSAALPQTQVRWFTKHSARLQISSGRRPTSLGPSLNHHSRPHRSRIKRRGSLPPVVLSPPPNFSSHSFLAPLPLRPIAFEIVPYFLLSSVHFHLFYLVLSIPFITSLRDEKILGPSSALHLTVQVHVGLLTGV